jgi:RHS repeat-associated protein
MKTSAQHSDGSGLVYRDPFVYGRSATNRWHFSGKEDQDVDFDLPYTDFGARLYAPNLGRWITPDPESEKYYDFSPYAYCANDPVNLVDPDGRDLTDYYDKSGNLILHVEDGR